MTHIVRAMLLGLLALVVGCSDPGPVEDGDITGDGDVSSDGDADRDQDGDADDDIDRPDDNPYAVTGLVPNHGIFSGMTEVIIRGRGFDLASIPPVFFGDVEVVPLGI